MNHCNNCEHKDNIDLPCVNCTEKYIYYSPKESEKQLGGDHN